MLNGNQRRLRVAIQLAFNSDNDTVDGNDDNNNTTNNNMDISASLLQANCHSPPLTLYQSLRVIDQQTLNIRVKPGMTIRQHFDHVCRAADDVLNAQVSVLLDDLFLNRRDGRLLFFDGQRDGRNVISLFKLLIEEVNMRVEQLEANISKINLLYLKSDYKHEERDQENGVISTGAHVNGHRVCHFFNTKDLLKWLLKVFRLARSVATVYESLDINFRIKVTADADLDTEEVFDVRLAVLDLYFTKMDDSSRRELYDFVNLVAERPSDTPQETEMTSLLKYYMKEGAEGSSLLLCNISPKMKCNKSNAFLLATTVKIYEIFTQKENRTNYKRSLSSSQDSAVNMSANREITPLPKSRAISFHIPFNERILKKTRLSQRAYSNDDLNKLRNWYTKLDEGFAEARKLMESYYARKYKIKAEQLCDDIKFMSRAVDFINSKSEAECSDEEKVETDEELQDLFDKCKDSLQKMCNELESSNFADNLKLYFYTKNFSHSQHMLSFQVKKLEDCKELLNEVLDQELEALNSMLFKDDI